MLADDPDRRRRAWPAASAWRPAPTTAEFAIVVGDALQGQGLGTALARALADAAHAAGIRRFSGHHAGRERRRRAADRATSRRASTSRAASGGVRELLAELPRAA